MTTKQLNSHYTVDCIDCKVYEETDNYLKIENFLKIDYLFGEGDFFQIDISDGILELSLYDNNHYSMEENIEYLLLYFGDIGTEMFNHRTLRV